MSNRHLPRLLGSLAIAGFLFAPSARGELAAWDEAKVTALAKELETATHVLYETYIEKHTPDAGTMQSQAYYRLKQEVRLLRVEAGWLAESLEKGAGRDETLPVYDHMMQLVRAARLDAGRVVVHDVGERAAVVRGVLNQLGPYYDPDFDALPPHPHIERSPNP
jgi:hypothetical protein